MCLWPAQARVHTDLFSVQQDDHYPDQITITATSNGTDRVFALAEVGNVYLSLLLLVSYVSVTACTQNV